jgi:hypothetical protein
MEQIYTLLIILNTSFFFFFHIWGIFFVDLPDRETTKDESIPNIAIKITILGSLLLFLAQVTQAISPKIVGRFGLCSVVASEDINFVHVHDSRVLSNAFS